MFAWVTPGGTTIFLSSLSNTVMFDEAILESSDCEPEIWISAVLDTLLSPDLIDTLQGPSRLSVICDRAIRDGVPRCGSKDRPPGRNRLSPR